MPKCTECQEHLIEDLKENDWVSLMNLLIFLRDEERITNATYESAADKLMRLKMYAMSFESILFSEPPTEESINAIAKRLRKQWLGEEDEV